MFMKFRNFLKTIQNMPTRYYTQHNKGRRSKLIISAENHFKNYILMQTLNLYKTASQHFFIVIFRE